MLNVFAWIFFAVSFILTCMSAVLWLIATFSTSVVWGLACMFIPFASIFFMIKHWEKAKQPLFIGLVATFFAITGTLMAVKSGGSSWKIVQKCSQQRESRSHSSKPETGEYVYGEDARALGAAARAGNMKVLRRIILSGANVNSQSDEDGWTPLMEAAAFGQVEAFKYLLGRGANPEVKDLKGRTALDLARSRNKTEAAALIEKES